MKLPDDKNTILRAPDSDPYDVWMRKPTPSNLNSVVKSLRPTIDNAISSYAGGSSAPTIRSQAKLLAARAVKSYDPTRGAKLNTHVMSQLQPLMRYKQQTSKPVRMSERRLRQLSDLEQLENDFKERHGRDPSDVEIADTMGLSLKAISRIRTYKDPFSDLTASPGSVQADQVISRVDPQEIWFDYVYHDLSDIDRNIIDWKLGRKGQALSNTDIARKLRLSNSAVTQRLAKIQTQLDKGLELGNGIID